MKFHSGPRTPNGIPDILACYRGRFLGIELKAPERKPEGSMHQKRQIALIKHAGGIGFVTNNIDDIKRALDEIDKMEDA